MSIHSWIFGDIVLCGKHVEKTHIVRLEISEDNIETNLPVDVAHSLGEPRTSGVLFFLLSLSCYFMLMLLFLISE